MAAPEQVLAPLADPRTIDDVLYNIDLILDWSSANGRKIGYFAVLYKRVTLGIKAAVENGEFRDGEWIKALDVHFARRYFDALNAYFHPEDFKGLTLPWEVCFVGDDNDKATMLQHMLAGLNAHITFDLAPAMLSIEDPTKLGARELDFDKVNDVLGRQIPGMLKIVEKISPRVHAFRVLPREEQLLAFSLANLRESAWEEAAFLAENPDKTREKTVNQAAWVAALGAWYLNPPDGLLAFPAIVHDIGEAENPNVAENMAALLAEPLVTNPAETSDDLLFLDEAQSFAGRLLTQPLQISASVVRSVQRIPSIIRRALPIS